MSKDEWNFFFYEIIKKIIKNKQNVKCHENKQELGRVSSIPPYSTEQSVNLRLSYRLMRRVSVEFNLRRGDHLVILLSRRRWICTRLRAHVQWASLMEKLRRTPVRGCRSRFLGATTGQDASEERAKNSPLRRQGQRRGSGPYIEIPNRRTSNYGDERRVLSFPKTFSSPVDAFRNNTRTRH